MRLYLVRHAIAAEPGAGEIVDDASRPLTPEGIRKMRRHARALVRLGVELEEIWSSPLVRAWQTAELLLGEFGPMVNVRQFEALAPPGDAHAVSAALRPHCSSSRGIALVGHEPFLSDYASRLLFGVERDSLVFKKGGVARIDVRPHDDGLRGQLAWLLTPRVLGKVN